MKRFTGIKMRKEIRESVQIPKYYGIAWVSYETNIAVCYPIPLNLIFGFALMVWIVLKKGPYKLVRAIETWAAR
jgi:hypothetical protein